MFASLYHCFTPQHNAEVGDVPRETNLDHPDPVVEAEGELANLVVSPLGFSQVSNSPASSPNQTPLPSVTPVLLHSENSPSSSSMAQRDWKVPGRTRWEFKGSAKGGGDDPGSSEVFTCQDCKQMMTTKFSLKSHQKFHCPKRGLDHRGLEQLEAAHRSGRAAPSESQKSNATTYKCDSEMEQFISTHPSAY